VREELGIVGDAVSQRIVPDVSVQRPSEATGAALRLGGMAVLERPRAELTEWIEVSPLDDVPMVCFVEIRDSRTGHEVVTLIEILSPSNKQPGIDHDKYVQKRTEILNSGTSLIEIDLLRAGRRDFFGPEVYQRLMAFDPPLEYFALVQRAWKRGAHRQYQLFPARLMDSLPVIAVPLRQSETESSLDLQYAFQQTYERGPYRRGAVDYSQPPSPPLPEPQQVWANACLAAWRKLQGERQMKSEAME
jgi:hypothetical protein